MRSIAFLAGAALALTACAKTAEKDSNLETNQAQPARLADDGTGANKLAAVPVDPLTATSAGLSIASSLKSLFGSNGERDLKKIRKQLGELAQQNRQILKTLADIVTILNSMGVTIRENVRLETIFNLEAAISGQGDQLYETWMAEIDDRRAQRQAINRYRDHILPRMRDLTHELMNEGYGYSAFDSVGHGMLMEFWMSRRVGERAAFRRQAGTTYLAYFDRALDPTLAGTPGHALAEAVAQRDRMKSVLDAADAQIRAGFSTSRDYDTFEQSGRRITERKIRETLSAAGDQSAGYKTVTTTSVIRERTYNEPSETSGTCPRCLQLDNAIKDAGAKNMKSLQPDPRDPGTNTPVAKVNYWNAVRRTFQSASKEAEALGKSNETLRIYQSEARLAQQER